MIIKLTRHAKEMAIERGITLEQIKIAIKRGSTTRQTNGYLSVYSYFRIAWKKVGDVHLVKSVMVAD